VYKLYKDNETLFNNYVSAILCGNSLPEWSDNQLNLTDCVRGLFNYFTNCYCIHPTIAKSHTFGNDGSGVNMDNTGEDPNVRAPLDKNSTFEISRTDDNKELNISKEIIKKHAKTYSISKKEIIKAWLKYALFCLNGKDRYKTINEIKKMKELKNGK